MKNVRLIRTIMFLLSFCLAFSSFGAAFAASVTTASDLKGHPAESVLRDWMNKGLVKGYKDGSFKPNNSITRAELTVLVNKSFGFTQSGNVKFKDVKPKDWYYGDVSKAVAAGYISGYKNGTFGPNKHITRQEVAVIVSKLLNLEPSSSSASYKDLKNAPTWSKGFINAVVEAGVMTGYKDQTFRPAAPATRAEAIVVLDGAIKYKEQHASNVTYSKSGVYGPATGMQTVNKDVVINAPGVILQNMTITGNLLLDEGIGEGDVHLKNVTVKGTTTVKGGGANSVHFENSVLVTVIVNKKDGSIRIVVEGSTVVQEVTLQSGAKLEESSNATGAGFSNVTLSQALPKDSLVTLEGTFENVDIMAAQITVQIPEGSVEHLNVDDQADNATINLSKEAQIVSLVLDAIANVLGQGKIDNADINVSGTKIEMTPSNVDVADGVNANVGGRDVTSIPPVVTPPSTGGGNQNPGGGNTSTPLTKVVNVTLSNTGVAAWDNVQNESGYSVQLYKNGAAEGAAISKAANNVSHDFLAAMRSAGAGSYTVKVTAKGNGTNYSDGPVSDESSVQTIVKLTTVSDVVWHGSNITWKDISNEKGYSVQLYKDGDAAGDAVTVEANIEEYNYGAIIQASGDGKFTVKVMPIADTASLFIDGDQSAASGAKLKSSNPAIYHIVGNVYLDGADKTGAKVAIKNAGGAVVYTAVYGEAEGVTAVGKHKLTDAQDQHGTIDNQIHYYFDMPAGTYTIVVTLPGQQTDITAAVTSDPDPMPPVDLGYGIYYIKSLPILNEPLYIQSAYTIDSNGNGVLDSYLIFTNRPVNDSSVNVSSFLIDGESGTGFYTGSEDNDDSFFIDFNENGHGTADLPQLTATTGAFKDNDGVNSRVLVAEEEVEKDFAEPNATLTPPVEGTRTQLVVTFSERLHAETLAITDINALLASATNDALGSPAAISVASVPNSVSWDTTDINAPVATITIPATTFVQGQTIRLNFNDGVVKDVKDNDIRSFMNIDQTVLSDALVFTTSDLHNAKVNRPYMAALQTTGGSGVKAFTVTSGSLPTGLTLNIDGTITGTPDAEGTYTFTISVTDSGMPPVSVSRDFSIIVTSDATAPKAPLSIQPKAGTTLADFLFIGSDQDEDNEFFTVVLPQNTGAPDDYEVGDTVYVEFGTIQAPVIYTLTEDDISLLESGEFEIEISGIEYYNAVGYTDFVYSVEAWVEDANGNSSAEVHSDEIHVDTLVNQPSLDQDFIVTDADVDRTDFIYVRTAVIDETFRLYLTNGANTYVINNSQGDVWYSAGTQDVNIKISEFAKLPNGVYTFFAADEYGNTSYATSNSIVVNKSTPTSETPSF